MAGHTHAHEFYRAVMEGLPASKVAQAERRGVIRRELALGEKLQIGGQDAVYDGAGCVLVALPPSATEGSDAGR